MAGPISGVRTSRLVQEKKRNRRFVLLTLSASVALFSLYQILTQRDWYLLQQIRLSGNHYLTDAQIVTALDLQVGVDDLHHVSTEEIEAQLKSRLIYVAEVQASKHLREGVLDIQIVERTPSVVVIYRTSEWTQGVLADLEGVVIRAIDDIAKLPASLPVIEVSSARVPKEGTRITSEAVMHGLEVIRVMDERVPELKEQLVKIQPDHPAKILISFRDHPPGWLAIETLDEGLENLAIVLHHSGSELGSISYIDARFEGVVYCGG